MPRAVQMDTPKAAAPVGDTTLDMRPGHVHVTDDAAAVARAEQVPAVRAALRSGLTRGPVTSAPRAPPPAAR